MVIYNKDISCKDRVKSPIRIIIAEYIKISTGNITNKGDVMSIRKSKRQLRNLTAKPAAALMTLLFVFAFTVSSHAQDVDAQVPVIVTNTKAGVTITPPAVGRGTGTQGAVEAAAQTPFDIKLISRPLPEALSVSHRPQTTARGTGAQVSRSRGNVNLNLQSQQYQNAVVSLHSINGRRILSGKASASGSALSISRSNISAGVYLLSVKSASGNSFADRINHGGGRLNINVAFSGAAGQSIYSMAEDGPDYGEWTITVAEPGYITESRKFYPVPGNNTPQSFELTAEKTRPEPQTFTETVGSVNFQMVYIPGGEFTLGCGTGGGCPPNTATVSATVSPYFIGAATVSSALWNAVMGTSSGGFGGGPSMNWYEAHEFACKLSQLTGRNYRMMTEAEFEFAAKNQPAGFTLGSGDEWAYNTWSDTHMGGTDPVGPGSGTHNQKTRRNTPNNTSNITGRLIRSIEGRGPALRLVLSAQADLPPNYVHPCRLHAPEMGEDPVNSYRDPRWVTGSEARWTTPTGGMGGANLRLWEDGTAMSGGTPCEPGTGQVWNRCPENGIQGATYGQWFTSNNIVLVFVPNPGTGQNQSNPIRYMYIFLNESDASFIGGGFMGGGGAGRVVKEAASRIEKPVIPNLMRGEDLARSQLNFETFYKMVDMVNMPEAARGQDERLLDGPNHGWLQLNYGATHHYRKDVDREEFRFRVSGAWLATGSWFTINNTFLRVTNRNGHVTEYLYDYTENYTRQANVMGPGSPAYEGPAFWHNSFMDYERGDFRVFVRLPNDDPDIARMWSAGASELQMNAPAGYGGSTFVPAVCPTGGCR